MSSIAPEDASSVVAPGPAPTVTTPGAESTTIELGKDMLKDQIEALKHEQATMRAAKKKITKDLKNAERRRKRLRKRAKQLSDDDLIAVLRMRAGTPTPNPSGSSSSSGAQTATASTTEGALTSNTSAALAEPPMTRLADHASDDES